MRIVAKILGSIALFFGALFLLTALLLLFTGKMNEAAIFLIPGAALGLAGTNLITYGKRKAVSDKKQLPKE